ncbi:hypothetical protein [Thioalkalivibrio thiocyanodenitrificans]|uniref:hypothetical protein n=1 Tax=Thioalkalivibrio thiocyanodenitrificans TaxID=243063 RepID=UPI00035E914B|nr:hypothetical protein [Thioalkalivibrio thiocyanodenitrificans]
MRDIPASKTVLQQGTVHEAVRYEHNAFGRVTLTKRQGSGNLFGSALKHSNQVCLTIERATLDRHLSTDWVRGTDTIVEMVMSEAQWAQLVSSMGCGTGTPVTLTRAPTPGTPSDPMPGLAAEPTKKVFDDEIRQACEKQIQDAKGLLERFEQMLESGKAIPKKEARSCVRRLRTLVENMPQDMAFLQSRFVESMEKTVEAGKAEIEAHVANVAMRTGLDTLRQQAPRLSHDQDSDE